DVRVIAATNRDLKAEIQQKTFREDLYFRLNVFPIESVPLRRRLEDIPILAQEFLNRACQKFNRPTLVLRERDVETLKAYHWPGNVRELENVIERQVITADGRLDLDLLGQESGALAPTTPAPPDRHFNGDLLTEQDLRDLEKQNLLRALKISGGRVFGEDGAAALLGVKPTTLTSRLKKLKLEPREFQADNQ
ncbi:MAG: sigma 54-interacting transcriptional regulator, partial [Pseudomonadota bacterium]|nr:sigma 54-interacting transcriptional regulator [Pseudomonadota bacterium]